MASKVFNVQSANSTQLLIVVAWPSLNVQLLFVWLGDCFWPVGCLAVWLLVVGYLLVH